MSSSRGATYWTNHDHSSSHRHTFVLRDGRRCETSLGINAIESKGRSSFLGRAKNTLSSRYRLEALSEGSSAPEVWNWYYAYPKHGMYDSSLLVLKEAWTSHLHCGGIDTSLPSALDKPHSADAQDPTLCAYRTGEEDLPQYSAPPPEYSLDREGTGEADQTTSGDASEARD